MHRALLSLALLSLLVPAFAEDSPPAAPIDRHALVSRHHPTLTRIDPASPFMVGNGNIAFTADITGLQTFQEQYSQLVPLMTQAQWAWHSFPNPGGYTYESSLVPIDIRGTTLRYPWLHDWSQASRPNIAWLRENPHRFSLGRLSLLLRSADGEEARFEQLRGTSQTLDLWRGALLSRFEFENEEVRVETRMHPDLDMLIVTLRGAAIAAGRLGVTLRFPGVATQLNPDPADWSHPKRHRTSIRHRDTRTLSLERNVDSTRYYAIAAADCDVTFTERGPHAYDILPTARQDVMTVMILFSPDSSRTDLPDSANARNAVTDHWQRYWSAGGMVDLSGSTDPRATELERRIVLSQYLMAVNASGSLPPQEEGLFSNSWNGKFHLEMHLWHAAHFAAWGRSQLLERSMGWYQQQLPAAKARARDMGVRGAWWPKMVGPEGRESPSTINPFIMWQQPHPIFLAELIYRDQHRPATLQRYRELVFETAEMLASAVHLDTKHDRYVLGPPIIPAQEVFPPLSTFNPAFELEYFRFGLETAQRWRERLGAQREPHWDKVLAKLSPLPQQDGLYLPTESSPQFWSEARAQRCSTGRTDAQCLNRDHPSFLGALGLLPGTSVDRDVMRRTLRTVESDWDLRQTWGWDHPLMAMTATRLREPEKALQFLLTDSANFQFGQAGMTPRAHLETNAGTVKYQRVAETYFPSNGGLLLAVALMAAGWDGEESPTPGFPENGKWKVKVEGVRSLP
ncbi:hypothetical protein HNQ60_001142 [Povalibacter uvarum]|uniref:Glycoside hydrolase family 65 n=1 Tax=Povalibacter uvarum TaxID=732238 RepID=A0A841HHN5_9GAMM|nr:hypothetical protein [Povalibacter uvarum]MBB6092296.1 hypothetical protein [Povalibacter uvarum]